MSITQPIGNLMPETPDKPRRQQVSPDEVPLSEQDQLILELVEVGVALRKAEHLVRRYSKQRIRRQLDWLPLRSPRRPGSLLITAIENDYDKPAYADGN